MITIIGKKKVKTRLIFLRQLLRVVLQVIYWMILRNQDDHGN